MIQLLIPSIVSSIIFFFAIPAFSSGMNYRTMHRYRHIGPHFDTGAIYSIQKRNIKLGKPWKHMGKKFTHRCHPPRYTFDPRSNFHGNREPEQTENVEINIIIDESVNVDTKELPIEKKKTYLPPHIINLNDSDPNQTDKHLSSAKSTEGVMLIHGTRVSEMEHLKE